MKGETAIGRDPTFFGSAKILIFKMIERATEFSNLSLKINQKEGHV